jgi:8-oxo-dGTP pyrophosphatase MutT (NUDIX family)
MANESELDSLARRFGAFERKVFEYKTLSPGFAAWVKNLMRRRGEIVLVVPRPAGRILLHTKEHYPENIYRLPTGGIHQGEDVEDAAEREGEEELGFEPESLRLLGVLDNVFWLEGERLSYPSFVFKTELFAKKPKPTDPDEPISGFRDADGDELRLVALTLASLPRQWGEWGRFRSTSHMWLAERLQNSE